MFNRVIMKTWQGILQLSQVFVLARRIGGSYFHLAPDATCGHAFAAMLS